MTAFPQKRDEVSPATDDGIAGEALRWFVRARADDFSQEEREALAAWLSAAAAHRVEYERLKTTWQVLDALREPLSSPAWRQPTRHDRRTFPFRLVAFAAACCVALILVFPVLVGQHYATPNGVRQVISPAEGISVTLNADTEVEVSGFNTLRLVLRRGDIYIDVDKTAQKRLEVVVGEAVVRDIGTRFAVRADAAGGAVAVAEGLVEIRLAGRSLSLPAGHQATFSAERVLADEAVDAADVAPWQRDEWHFRATSLQALAGEMERQRNIRLDLGETAVARLTISGRFDMNDPPAMLGAVAQVHALKLTTLGPQHYLLSRR